MEIKHELQNGKIVHKIHLAKGGKGYDVLIKELPSFVWIPEFINIAGSLFYEREGDRKPNDIDIIVRAREKDDKFIITLDQSLRLKIDRVMRERVGETSEKWLTPEWLSSTFGPNWKYQTGWDLVLVPHQPQEIREMNEPEFAEEFYKKEGYREFCDFGGGHFSKFVREHPEFKSKEFRGYVIVHNKADRDSGELEDIASSEILRLSKEFAQKKNIQIKKRHSREKCMDCDKPTFYECLWAEGIGHAWFCKKHFKEWAMTGDGKGEIISVKEVKDGVAAKKYGDNRNPNIWAELKREFYKGEGVEKKLSDKQRIDYERETAIINENSKKPLAGKVHRFKSAKWTHPNGHPRCMICGDEEPIGGVCNMPDSWYGKHEFDDEEAWEKERKTLREKKIMKQVQDIEKLDKEWDKKQAKVTKEQQEIAKFTFKKIDKTEYIVGGVVYFSYKEDSQEDWTTPPEVWKALKRFMLKKKKLKVMHQGKEREIPIVENYFVEEEHHKGGMSPKNLLEKGDWWISIYLGDKINKEIWKRVLSGELTGFSIAGRAGTPSA